MDAPPAPVLAGAPALDACARQRLLSSSKVSGMTLVEQVVSLRRTLNRLITRRVSEETERSFLQLRVLRAVERGEASTQAALGDLLVIDAPTVSRLVGKLEADGLVVRRPGKDRRCVCLEVTAAAAPELEALARSIDWLDGEVRRHLTDEEAHQAAELLGRLQAGLTEGG